MAPSPTLCVHCRILKINPFCQLTKTLVPPFRVLETSQEVSFQVPRDWNAEATNQTKMAAMFVIDLDRPLPRIFCTDTRIGIIINGIVLFAYEME